MDWIALGTVIVTFLLGVIGFVVNSIIQRKNNSIKVITQYRLDRKKLTQDLTADILARTDSDYHNALSGEQYSENIKQLVNDVSTLRSVYYFSFRRDAEFVSAAYDVKNAYCKQEKDWQTINAARAKFAHLSDIYTSTDWQRIKVETVGKSTKKSGLPSWEIIYQNNEKYFSESQNNAVAGCQGNNEKKSQV